MVPLTQLTQKNGYTIVDGQLISTSKLVVKAQYIFYIKKILIDIGKKSHCNIIS